MPNPPDITLVLAETLTLLQEGEAAFRRIRDRGEPVAIEAVDGDELLAKFAGARANLEVIEPLVAAREDGSRAVFHTMSAGFATLTAGLMAMATTAADAAQRDLFMTLADATLNLGRAAAIGAMGVDTDPPPPRWTPTVVPGGAA